jgi:hypothetical protein
VADSVEERWIASRHDCERSGSSAFDAAGDGRIDKMATQRMEALRNPPRIERIARTHVNSEKALAPAGNDTVRTKHDGLHFVRRRHQHKSELDLNGRGRGTACLSRPLRDEALDWIAVAVPYDDHLVACRKQAPGNGFAHQAEAENADAHPSSPPLMRDGPRRRRPYSGRECRPGRVLRELRATSCRPFP